MRTLATIQRISDIQPFPNADEIEVASVLGWKVVAKKGEFKVGDFCVYVEIDSILPEKPEFEFLRPRKFRIKTMKMRGQISQGICFSLTILPLDENHHVQLSLIVEGADVTELLCIVKYEPIIPAELSGIVKCSFPSFIPKTDETRIQVLQDVLDFYAGQKFYTTEKIDGTSVTYYIKDGEFGVCSRNIELKESEGNSFWKFARSIDLENKLKSFNMNIAFQGELIGEGIQGNHLGIKGQIVKFFNAFDIDKYTYFSYVEMRDIFIQAKVDIVPRLVEYEYILTSNIDELIKYATRKSLINSDIWAEGVVFRPLVETINQSFSDRLDGGRVSFKVVNPEYLLKYG